MWECSLPNTDSSKASSHLLIFPGAWSALWGRPGGIGSKGCYYVNSTMDYDSIKLAEDEDGSVCFFRGELFPLLIDESNHSLMYQLSFWS